jgi:hypothetical protein
MPDSPLGTSIIKRRVVPKQMAASPRVISPEYPPNTIQHSVTGTTLPWPGRCFTCGALLSSDDFRVEPRANGDASSVMASAVVGLLRVVSGARRRWDGVTQTELAVVDAAQGEDKPAQTCRVPAGAGYLAPAGVSRSDRVSGLSR